MPLVKGGQVVTDEFALLADDDASPPEVAILVPAERFLADPDTLLSDNRKVGVIWPNDWNVADLVPYLEKVALIVLVFPSFRDGRAYSQARLLRERYGFRGELRATGQVLRDQFVFMLRAGFNAFDVKKDSDAEAFAKVAKRYSVFYQPTGDGRVTAFHQRLLHHHSEGVDQ